MTKKQFVDTVGNREIRLNHILWRKSNLIAKNVRYDSFNDNVIADVSKWVGSVLNTLNGYYFIDTGEYVRDVFMRSLQDQVSPLKYSTTTKNNKCTCSIETIMRVGCRCGCFKREMEAKNG